MQGPWNYISFVVIRSVSYQTLQALLFCLSSISCLLRFGRVEFKFSAQIHTGCIAFRKPEHLALPLASIMGKLQLQREGKFSPFCGSIYQREEQSQVEQV